MTDTEQIIFKMQEGFGDLHDRLNKISEEAHSRQITCSSRFSGIEQSIAIRAAINGVNEGAKKKRVDFQTYLVRGALSTIIVGVLLIIWKIFVGHIDLIVK